MHSIEFTRDAQKVLARMPRDLQALVRSKIEAIAADPHGAHNNVTRLQGRLEFRLRVHDWRVIYRVSTTGWCCWSSRSAREGRCTNEQGASD